MDATEEVFNALYEHAGTCILCRDLDAGEVDPSCEQGVILKERADSVVDGDAI